MNIENKFVKALVKYRITITCLLFFIVMMLAFWVVAILGVTSEEYGVSKTIVSYVPSAIFFSAILLLAFYITTGILKSKLEKQSIELGEDESETIKSYDEALSFGYKKVRVFFACFGSFIGLMILISFLCIILGFQDYMDALFNLCFYIGAPVWFLLTWKFFSDKLS